MSNSQTTLFVGLSTVDIIYLIERLPRPDEKIVAIRQVASAGGPATNAAAAYAWLGGDAHLVSGVGQHDLAVVIRRDLADLGVRHTDLLPERRLPPTISSIMVSEATGDRAIVSLGAGTTGARASQLADEWLENCACVLVDGHEPDLSIAVAAKARAMGIPVVLDAGSWKAGMPSLLKHVDYAICSSTFLPPGCSDTPSVLRYLRESGVPRRAVTRGATPILVEGANPEREMERLSIAPATPSTIVDTTGAGDILHGAFCYYLAIEGRTFVGSVEAAAKVAGQSCTGLGCREWMRRSIE
jgi:sugar/nucleoside kinase (ribokinase family)